MTAPRLEPFPPGAVALVVEVADPSFALLRFAPGRPGDCGLELDLWPGARATWVADPPMPLPDWPEGPCRVRVGQPTLVGDEGRRPPLSAGEANALLMSARCPAGRLRTADAEPRRPLLVGEAPSAKARGPYPLHAPSGDRLAAVLGGALAGVAPYRAEEILARFDAVNLLSAAQPAAASGKGDAFDPEAAARAYLALAERGDLAGRAVVLLGRRVLAAAAGPRVRARDLRRFTAFGAGDRLRLVGDAVYARNLGDPRRDGAWLAPLPAAYNGAPGPFAVGPRGPGMVAWVPHPSGVCRSYNDAEGREAGRRVLELALGWRP